MNNEAMKQEIYFSVMRNELTFNLLKTFSTSTKSNNRLMFNYINALFTNSMIVDSLVVPSPPLRLHYIPILKSKWQLFISFIMNNVTQYPPPSTQLQHQQEGKAKHHQLLLCVLRLSTM